MWPDEPWWKLSGLFDFTIDQSVQAGVADLETAMAAHGNDDVVIYGLSQGATIANVEKRKLAEQYPAGTTAPDIDFVLSGDPNVPNGGLFARFPGLYIPILDWSFNGPEPTNTPFDTVVITRQYDAFADFPLYPLNVIADLNAVLGFIYVHMYDLDVSLAPDPSTSPPIKSQYGDTSYYFFPTEDLPLFAPLRTLGVPEKYIDVVEPVFRVIVELGYDRSIPPGKPTPARLIPMHDPATVVTDLVNAVGEGIDNAAALSGSPPPLQGPRDTSTVTTFGGADANDGSVVGSPGKVADLNVGDGISHSLSAPNPFRSERRNNQLAADGETSGPQTLRGGWTKLTATSLTDGLKFTPARPTSSTGDNQTGAPAAKTGANVNDTLQQAADNVKKTVRNATDGVTSGLKRLNRHNVDSKTSPPGR